MPNLELRNRYPLETAARARAERGSRFVKGRAPLSFFPGRSFWFLLIWEKGKSAAIVVVHCAAYVLATCRVPDKLLVRRDRELHTVFCLIPWSAIDASPASGMEDASIFAWMAPCRPRGNRQTQP